MSINVGLSTATFFPQWETEDTFQVIEGLGVDTCEVFLRTFSEYEESFSDLLQERVGKVLSVHSVHSLNSHFEPELFNIGDRTRNDAEVLFRKVCSAGKKLNAKFYTFHGPSILKRDTYKLNEKRVGEVCARITSISGEYGIKLSYENVYWAYYNFPEFFPLIEAYAPDLYATLDIKQAKRAGISHFDFLKKMGKKLSTVHLSDYNNQGTLCVPGKGVVDFYRLFCEINNYGIDVDCMIELYKDDYSSLDELKESVDFLKNVAFKANR